VSEPTSSSSFLEVWQYEIANHVNQVQLLFVNGQLQTTTLAAGTVHAEALVHPIMVASTQPERILVISIEPSAILREILKHKSVQSVKLLGANVQAIKMIEHHMPSLLDCSFLGTLQTNCLDQDHVQLIEEDVMTWLESADESQDEEFDVIFVDVPMGTDEWVSLEMISYLSGLFNTTFHHGAIVLSAGITPSLFDKDARYEPTTRDELVYKVVAPVDTGGLDLESVIIYDEVCVYVCPWDLENATSILTFFVFCVSLNLFFHTVAGQSITLLIHCYNV
jgi:spermidine synthase